ncbi:hypothetical protein WJX82_003684 [Trebouxia sp. C0006]
MLDGNLFVLVLQTRPGTILHSLSHRDLLSLASTCQACKEVICVFLLPQAQDVSAGHETNAVPCSTSLTTVSRAIGFCRASDLSFPYNFLGFTYTRHNVLPGSLKRFQSAKGCACTPELGTSSCLTCECGQARGGSLPKSGQAPTSYGHAMLECGPACSCGLQCPFRESQRGLSVVVALQSSEKGMSVIASQNIDQGQFVAQYAGEMLTNSEADRRLAEYDATRAGVGHALMVVRETLPSGTACLRFNIDATCIGNVARFFNHSCDGGNLRLEIVRSRGSPLPHVAMFASKDIQTGGEMTFSYGSSANSVEPTSFAAKELHVPLADTVVKLKSNQRRRCVCCTKNCSDQKTVCHTHSWHGQPMSA